MGARAEWKRGSSQSHRGRERRALTRVPRHSSLQCAGVQCVCGVLRTMTELPVCTTGRECVSIEAASWMGREVVDSEVGDGTDCSAIVCSMSIQRGANYAMPKGVATAMRVCVNETEGECESECV